MKAACAASEQMAIDKLCEADHLLEAARQDNRLLMTALTDTESRASFAEELSERRGDDLIGLGENFYNLTSCLTD